MADIVFAGAFCFLMSTTIPDGINHLAGINVAVYPSVDTPLKWPEKNILPQISFPGVQAGKESA